MARNSDDTDPRGNVSRAGRSMDWLDAELSAWESRGLLRTLRSRARAQGPRIPVDGRDCIHFGANDYLGLCADPRLTDAAMEACREEGWGAGASPLLSGRGESHARLEEALAEYEGTQAALVFSSGYAANVGAITSLVDDRDVILSDELNHASIIDGCRLSRASVRVYSHANLDQAGELLQASSDFRRRLIVTDGLFSMDGDLAPLQGLAELAERHAAMLLVDEAHATGVLGEQGRGAAEHLGVEDHVSVRVGTLSKALGCGGGFVAGSRKLIDWLVNRARTYIFSTAQPPANSRAALAALKIVQQEPWRRRELLARSRMLRDALAAQGWQLGASVSQIIPVVVGDPFRAVALSRALADRGLIVPAIRPPSVPAGQSRLRISLSYAHTEEMLGMLVEAFCALRMEMT